MREIVLSNLVKNLPTKKDTEDSLATLDAVKELFPHLVSVVKEINDGMNVEHQHNLAINTIKMKKDSWDKAFNERIKERINYQESIKQDISSTDNINEKLALYDKWLESINSSLIKPDEIY